MSSNFNYYSEVLGIIDKIRAESEIKYAECRAIGDPGLEACTEYRTCQAIAMLVRTAGEARAARPQVTLAGSELKRLLSIERAAQETLRALSKIRGYVLCCVENPATQTRPKSCPDPHG